jgi:phage-related tail fiber protein
LAKLAAEIIAKLLPPGAVQEFAMNTAPTGWLKANGAAVSRTTYAALFAAIGTTFGAGDGSTTFNLPDLRGEFVRGWDDGRGVDSGRVFGSSQLDQMQRITGNISSNRLCTTTISGTGALTQGTSGTLEQPAGSGSGSNIAIAFDSSLSPDARTSSDTSGETRPRNVALLYCIKT